MSVNTFYKELKWLISQIPSEKDSFVVNKSLVDSYHTTIDSYSNEIEIDLTRFKLTGNDISGTGDGIFYYTLALRTKLGSLIGFLEGEYGLSENNNSNVGPNVTVINNQTVAITINQSLQQIIEQASTPEEKAKLKELSEELEKANKDWGKIKGILKWALDFSEKLFFQLLPIILKNYGVTD